MRPSDNTSSSGTYQLPRFSWWDHLEVLRDCCLLVSVELDQKFDLIAIPLALGRHKFGYPVAGKSPRDEQSNCRVYLGQLSSPVFDGFQCEPFVDGW